MGLTTIYIIVCVSFILWLLLLLLIISKISALNNRISRLLSVLGEFDKMQTEKGPEGNKPGAKLDKK